MLSRLRGGRRAEAFQNAVTGHVEPSDRELSEFVHLAHTVREVPAVRLSAETRTAMRAHLVAEAEAVLAEPATPVAYRRPRQRRGLRIAVGTAVVVTAMSGGLVSVSANALPGDVLYPVKLGFERVELTFDGSPAEAGRTRFEHASSRLDEAEQLARAGEDDQVGGALDDFTDEAEDGANQLLRAFASNSEASSITAIRSFTHSAAGRLTTLAGLLDESTMPAYTEAVSTVTSMDKRAVATCPECTSLPPVDIPYNYEPEGGDDSYSLPPITLPELDDRFYDVKPQDSPNGYLTDPQIEPHGTDLPPTDDGDVVPPDNTDNDHKIRPHSGTDHESEPTDKGNSGPKHHRPDDGGLLPDLPNLPHEGGDSNGLPPAPLDRLLGPIDGLLGPLGKLGPLGPLDDLLGPLLGQNPKGSKNDESHEQLQNLLGPLLGGSDNPGQGKNDQGDDDSGPLDLLDPQTSGDDDSDSEDPQQDQQGPDQVGPQQDQDEEGGPLDDLDQLGDQDDESGEVEDPSDSGDTGDQDQSETPDDSGDIDGGTVGGDTESQ